VDPRLTGLLVGQTLHTTRAEVYRALIEATAFGARAIIERMIAYGVPVERVVCCGGIAEKNPLFMQIYADVLGRPMIIAGSPQTARARRRGVGGGGGRAGEGGHATSPRPRPRWSATGTRSTSRSRRREGLRRAVCHLPRAARRLRGVPGPAAELGTVMKRLLAIRERVNAGYRAGRREHDMGAHALRERVFRANTALAGTGLVIETFGNVSGADHERG